MLFTDIKFKPFSLVITVVENRSGILELEHVYDGGMDNLVHLVIGLFSSPV